MLGRRAMCASFLAAALGVELGLPARARVGDDVGDQPQLGQVRRRHRRSRVVASASAPRTEWPATNGRITRSGNRTHRTSAGPRTASGGIVSAPVHATVSPFRSRAIAAGNRRRNASAVRFMTPGPPYTLGFEIAGAVVQLQEGDVVRAAKLGHLGQRRF